MTEIYKYREFNSVSIVFCSSGMHANIQRKGMKNAILVQKSEKEAFCRLKLVEKVNLFS